MLSAPPTPLASRLGSKVIGRNGPTDSHPPERWSYTAAADGCGRPKMEGQASDAEAVMKKVVVLMAVLAFARVAAAQNPDDYRGGWRTDGGEAHTYEFSIRGKTVRGIY